MTDNRNREQRTDAREVYDVEAAQERWLKVWEEVGGVKSNTLAIKVVRNRC